MEETDNLISLSGVGNSEIHDLHLGTVAAKVNTKSHGPIIAIFHQYAFYGIGKTIHCPNQIRNFGHMANDIPAVLPGGKQRAKLMHGQVVPFCVHECCCYMETSYPTDKDME